MADTNQGEPRASTLRALAVAAAALTPWIAALLLLYALEQHVVWTPDQPLRPVASVAILALGMLLSFLLHSRLRRR